MVFVRWYAIAVLALAGTSACTGDNSNVVRGKGLTVATLPAREQARVYEAAIHGAFDVDESLSLLLDARLLPRGVGLAAEGKLSSAVAAELRRIGVTRGSCEPALEGTKGAPRCTAQLPGYIVRFSPVFERGGRGDSAQVYVYVQKYDIPNGEMSQTMRFERAYQVVRRGGTWRAATEARIPREMRGEPR